MRKAIALFSGGLDSTLAILNMKNQGIEVIGVTFLSLFGCKSTKAMIDKNKLIADRFGFEMITHDFTKEQYKIIKNPVYGLGKRMNPCMDCHILMLKEAKKIMLEKGADFVVTGEVLGQRPKSQRRDTFPVIDRDAGLEGLVVRPLSANIMNPTIPEKSGWIDRDKMYHIGGRGRKTQIALAKSIGWEDFPAPAGGCLLTDLGYTNRLKHITKDEIIPDETDILLVPVGRHFIYSDVRIITGRNKEDNDMIMEFAKPNDILMQAIGCGSPTTILRGETDNSTIELAASITARYSDNKKQKKVIIDIFTKQNKIKILEIAPAIDEEIINFKLS